MGNCKGKQGDVEDPAARNDRPKVYQPVPPPPQPQPQIPPPAPIGRREPQPVHEKKEHNQKAKNKQAFCYLDANVKCIAAIDLGTSRSAHGYTQVGNQGNVIVPVPCNTVIREDVDLKTETSVLFDRRTKKAIGFGTKARETYLKNQENYYLFSRFKMKLVDLPTSDSADQFPDYMNHEMELRTIVTESIRYLSDSILEIINRQNLNEPLTKKDIHWVLTIPCIFDEAPQGFMRNCALAAGIADYQLDPRLTLVRESEAASVELLHRIEEGLISDVKLAEGTDIAILDCGGGTADMSFLRVTSQKPFAYEQLKAPTGNAAGATLIDAELTELFSQLFGEEAVNYMRLQPEFVELMDKWETDKRIFTGSDNTDWIIDFKNVVDENMTYAKVTTAIQNYNARTSNTSLHLSNSKFKVTIPPALIRKWFDPLLKKIADDLLLQLSDSACSKISLLYMVGGFSGNPYLASHIKETIRKHRPGINVRVSDKPDIAIVQGAVLTAVENRIKKLKMPKTYGIEAVHFFNKDLHAEEKAEQIGDNQYSVCLFEPFVLAGDDVDTHFVTEERFFVPAYEGMTDYWVHLYAKDGIPEGPTYVDDKDLECINKLTIPIDPNTPFEERVIKISIEFGNEIQIRINDGKNAPIKQSKAEYLSTRARLPPGRF